MSDLLLDAFCGSLSSSLLRESFASVVFDFNATLNDVAPVSPILLSVYKKRKERGDTDGCLFAFLSFVFTAQIKFGECCV